MKRYRVRYTMDYEVVVEAESEDQAKDKASAIPQDKWEADEWPLHAEVVGNDYFRRVK